MAALVVALSLVVAETSTAEGRPIAVYSLGFFLLFSPKSRFVYCCGHWEGSVSRCAAREELGTGGLWYEARWAGPGAAVRVREGG